MVKTFKNNQAGHPKNTPRSITAIMGPAEASRISAETVGQGGTATKDGDGPNSQCQDERGCQGSVVTPPESKATGINSGGVKKERTRMAR